MGNTRNTGYLQNIVQYDASNNVILPSLTGTGSRMVISSSTGVLSAQDIPTLSALGGVPTSRTLTINGVSYDLSANRSWSALPIGGTTGQILTKNSGTDYDAAWMENYADWTAVLKHRVKASEAITKGQAVYVSSADGTNMIVSKASNATEGTSSKTMGLLESTVSTNGIANVITEGLLAGLNTASANAGDPVWLGTGGNLIYGLLNKPVAPAHLVFIGVVTRSNANNGEIFVKVQNGFEFGELHDYVQTGVLDNYVISYESSTSLYKPKSIATLLGYTPANAARTITINGTSYDLSADRSWTINSMVYPGAGIAVSTGSAWGTSLTDNSSNWNTAYGWGNHASAGYATTTYVGTQIANLVASSPAALDTLNELAAALGNDAAFSTTVSTALGNRLRVDINTQGLSATLQGYGRTNLGLGTAATSNTGDFAAASHTHSIANVTGLQTALDGKQASGSYAAATHSHIISDVTGLQTALDGKQASLGFTPYNSTNPNGYISSYTETDTLSSVVARGSSTTAAISAANFQVASQALNLDTVKTPGLYHYDGAYTGTQPIQNWYNVRTIEIGNSTRASQFVMPYNVDRIFYRRNTDPGWQGYVELYHTGNLPTIPTNNNQLTNGAGYITSSGSISGNAATANSATNAVYLGTHDLRTIAPNSHDAYKLRFGFTSYNNNNTAPWADYLHLRSYGDGSGGADNLVMFLKSGIGMRIWQQSFGSATAYSSYADVLHSSNYSSYALPLSGGTVTGDTNFGPDSGGDNGIRIRYGNSGAGYGRIRFHQDGTNHNTIHSFSASWQGGSFLGASAGALNIAGQYGVTFGGWNIPDAHINTDGIYVKAWATPSGSTGWNANSVLRLQQGSTGNDVYIEMRNRADVGDHAAILFTDNNVGGYIGFRTYASNNVAAGSDCMIYGTYNDHIFQNGSSGVFNGKTETFRIYANGSIRATGDVTAYSDKRVKENIITIDKALEKTLQLRGVFYNRTDKDDKSQKIGVIAQEIQEILPQVVNEDYNGLLSVSYGNITGLLIEAVKEQQTQIESQKSEIDELKDLVKQLINR
jgi:hypothetical protein